MVFKDADLMVTVVGGPNQRTDYHDDPVEEFFYQLEGDIQVKIQENGQPRTIDIKEGEIFLLPARTPHSPQRGANTVGLVMEVNRRPGMQDRLQWYCEKCNNLLHEGFLELKDIETELKAAMETFYASTDLRTCKVKECGAVMEPPVKLA